MSTPIVSVPIDSGLSDSVVDVDVPDLDWLTTGTDPTVVEVVVELAVGDAGMLVVVVFFGVVVEVDVVWQGLRTSVVVVVQGLAYAGAAERVIAATRAAMTKGRFMVGSP